MSRAEDRLTELLREDPRLEFGAAISLLAAEGLELRPIEYGRAKARFGLIPVNAPGEESPSAGSDDDPDDDPDDDSSADMEVEVQALLDMVVTAGEEFGIEVPEDELEGFIEDPLGYLVEKLTTGADPLTEEDVRYRFERALTERPEPWSTDEEVAEAFDVFARAHAEAARPAFVAELGDRGADFLSSCLGTVRAALPGEDWPTHEGTPMRGVLQLNVVDLPQRPSALRGVEMLTLFVAMEGDLAADWKIRTYADVGALVEVDAPTPTEWRSASWSEVTDQPPLTWCIEEKVPPTMFGRFQASLGKGRISQKHHRSLDRRIVHATTTKVGGWPTVIQSGPPWESWSESRPGTHETILQIGHHADMGLDWHDAGVCWLGRSRIDDDEWVLEWECR